MTAQTPGTLTFNTLKRAYEGIEGGHIGRLRTIIDPLGVGELGLRNLS